MQTAGSVWAAIALTLLAGSARAQSPRLIWNAPPACPGEQALQPAVERLLGRAALERAAIEAVASVSRRENGQFQLVLSIRTGETGGTRTVHAEECEKLLEVAAFAIALTLNPELHSEPPPASEEAAFSPPLPATPREEATLPLLADSAEKGGEAPPRRSAAPFVTPRPSSASSIASPVAYWLGLQGIASTSLLPRPALGGQVSVEAVPLRRFRFGALGKLFVRQQATLTSGSGGEFLLWMAQARACYQAPSSVLVGFCSTFQFGVEYGRGIGVAESLRAKSTLYGPGAAALALFPLSSRLLSGFGLEAFFPLTHDVFQVKAGKVHEIPAFSLELAFGFQIRPG